MVQDFIYRNSLYLREPQYKQILRAGDLEFTHVSRPDRELREELTAALEAEGGCAPELDPRDGVCLLRDVGGRPRILAS